MSWNSGTPGPGNSGKGLAAPYQLTVQVLYDNTAPAPALSTMVSYYDETNMQPSLNADGSPVMPAAYTYGGASLRAVDTTGATPVNKASTRMSYAGTAPTPAALVGSNPRNLPFLAYVIPYVAGSDAPITSCTYSATVSCASCGSPPAATGSLILDTTYTNGVRYLLPIAFDTIPALQQANSIAQVAVTISSQDAAGNVGTLPSTPFKFQIVAPPTIFAEDTNYSSEGDARAAFAFKAGNATYATMFDPGATIFGPEGARFARFVVYNPEPAAYAVTPTMGGVPGDSSHPDATWEAFEAWSDWAPGTIAGNGNCYDNPGGACGYSASPCNGGFGLYYFDGSTGCVYHPEVPGTRTNSEAEQATSPMVLGIYQVGASGEATATSASNGGVIVPAAIGNAPGRVALYVARPASAVARQIWTDYVRGTASLTWDAGTSRYQAVYATYDAGNGGSGYCGCDPSTGNCAGYWECYAGQSPWYKYLSAADSKIFGTISLIGSSVIPGTSTTFGTTRTGPQNVPFSRDIAH